ncbi:unnamed protein product [Cochlearia groenlandica]
MTMEKYQTKDNATENDATIDIASEKKVDDEGGWKGDGDGVRCDEKRRDGRRRDGRDATEDDATEENTIEDDAAKFN